ncbi:hypothetical protein [Paenibacillus sp. JNUCC31]|uniref:hypothetical protein n=1 Tax=Paenibacillus sp. JNUCC-31 TaxID=2777983 RepID=UPI001E45114E|nr:hypothetical protein [Paenibacillus sp. JNUCC-31]
MDKEEFLLILAELTDRQIMTYELLEDKTRYDVDITLSRLWNTKSYEGIDIILSIVVNLGLKDCYIRIKESVKEDDIDDCRGTRTCTDCRNGQEHSPMND